MREVNAARLAAEQIRRRLTTLIAAIEVETREGLEGDWTAIAEGFDAVKDLAEHGSANAWRVVYETSDV